MEKFDEVFDRRWRRLKTSIKKLCKELFVSGITVSAGAILYFAACAVFTSAKAVFLAGFLFCWIHFVLQNATRNWRKT
jgi:hypothetical protein